jgi:putative MATE family efflux protein
MPGRHPADRAIARLAVPALAALVAEPLFLLADAAIVGHLGTTPLAGLGIAATVLTTVVNVAVFLAYGTTGAVARLLGAGDVRRALAQGVDGCWLALGLGALAAAVGLPLVPTVVGWFDPTAAVAEQATTYLRISLLGLPAMLLVLAATGVLRGLQDTRTPLLVVVAGSVANAVLNVALVYGAGLGIAGSALGTVLAQAGMAAVFAAVVARGASRHGAPLRPDLPGVRRAFGAGVPLIVRTVALRVVLVVATAVATGLGTAELAAYQLAFTIWTLLAFVLDAIAIAAQALVGKALGAGDVAGARAATARMVAWGVAFGTVVGLVLLAVRTSLPALFTPDVRVQDLLAAALVVVALQQPLTGWAFVLDGVLIGAGDGRFLAVASALAALAFLPLAAAVATWDLGLVALWCAVGAWVAGRVVLLTVRVRGSAWAVTGAVRV